MPHKSGIVRLENLPHGLEVFNFRIQELALNRDSAPEENREINEALSGLNTLRREGAAWKSKAD
jgi:hypothetical protein